jgi:hypothetical protein
VLIILAGIITRINTGAFRDYDETCLNQRVLKRPIVMVRPDKVIIKNLK